MLNPHQFDEREGPLPSRRLVRASFVQFAFALPATDATSTTAHSSDAAAAVVMPREICGLIAGYAADWCLASTGDRFVKLWFVPQLLAPPPTDTNTPNTTGHARKPALEPFLTLTGWYGGRAQDVNAMCVLPAAAHAGAASRLVTVSDDVELWDALSGKCVGNFQAPASIVSKQKTLWSVAPFPGGTHMLSGGWDSTIRVWDARVSAGAGAGKVAGGKVVAELTAHSGDVRALAVLHNRHSAGECDAAVGDASAGPNSGRYFVSAGDDRTIRVWDTTKLDLSGDHTRTTPALTNELPALWLGLNKDDQHRRQLEAVAARSGAAQVDVLLGHTAPITCMAVQNPYGASAGQALGSAAAPSAPSSAASSTTVRLITGDKAGAVKLWLWDTATVSTLKPPPVATAAAGDAKADDGIVYGDGGDGSVASMDGSKGYLVDEDGYAMGMADTGADDNGGGPAAVGRAAPPPPVRDDSAWTIARAHASSVQCVALLEDGRHVVTGGADSLIKVWDLLRRHPRTGEPPCVAILDGHDAAVLTLVPLPASRGSSAGRGLMFASGSRDHTVAVWDLSQLPHLQPNYQHQTLATATSGAVASASSSSSAEPAAVGQSSFEHLDNHLQYQRHRFSAARAHPHANHVTRVLARVAHWTACAESVSALCVLDDSQFAFADDETRYAAVLPPPELYTKPWTKLKPATTAAAKAAPFGAPPVSANGKPWSPWD